VTLVTALLGCTVLAQAEEERPWAKGVSKENQQKAIALFREGNAALKESLFPKAAATYRDALRAWDHPAIHYNLALALVNLDQPIEVHEHLTAALKYGPAPLDDDKHQQAQRYLALVERQLSRVRVSCSFPGATVRLDGRPLFTAPGRWEGLVRAGPHTLTASLEGYLPDERSVMLAGSETRMFDLSVFKAEEVTEYQRAFSAAIPWATLAAGAAMAGAGVGLHLSARSGLAQYDEGIRQCAIAGESGGCFPTPALTQTRQAAEGQQTGAAVLYAAGGLAVAASAVLFYIGRPVAVRRTVNVEAKQATFLPLVAPGLAGGALSLDF
jgi:tetratricopeptide (TPR) repeat protein